tara:strand:+ start:1237 stop:1992 length:756 start_codon:yes stop_codon:yes gene_type:complete
MSEISIAIPAHDRGENGPKWMRELLDSLKQQTFQDFDVVVSDQSKNDNIMDVCKEYDFDFTYIKYGGKNACENINVALDNCEGRIIKIMFSDDVLVTNTALEKIHAEYDDPECKWLFTSFCALRDGAYTDCKQARWADRTLEGNNHLSSPSVVSFLNECKQHFDVDLPTKLLLDTDFYHRMRWNNGMPHFIWPVLVANREHDDRISSQATSQYDCVVEHPEGNWMMNRRELEYIQNKYPQFMKTKKYPDEN